MPDVRADGAGILLDAKPARLATMSIHDHHLASETAERGVACGRVS